MTDDGLRGTMVLAGWWLYLWDTDRLQGGDQIGRETKADSFG
jgi:hypothetical protein